MNLQSKARFPIFYKLMFIMLVIITPLYAISLYQNENNVQTVKRDMIQTAQTNLNFYGYSLSKEIEHIVNLQQEIANDNELAMISIALPVFDVETRRQMIIRLQKDLSKLKYSSSLIKEVTVYLPLINYQISTEQVDSFVENEITNSFLLDRELIQYPLLYVNNRIFINNITPDLFYRANANFIISVEISETSLKAYLQKIAANRNGEAAIMQSSGEWGISSQSGPGTLLNSYQKYKRSNGQSQLQSKQTQQSFHIGGESLLVLEEQFKYLNISVLYIVPEKIFFSDLKSFRYWVLGLSLISAILIFFVSYYIYRLIHTPLHKLVFAFRDLEKGNMETRLAGKRNDEFMFLYQHFNTMVERLGRSVVEVYEQKIHVQQAEMKQLQAQINPHFLYNSFFILSNMAKKEDFENIVRFTKFMGKYFKYITRNSIQSVTLAEEIKHAQVYAMIQSYRFQERIQVHFDDLPPAYTDLTVPGLIVQPILENAYHYALEQLTSDGHLWVRFEEINQGLLIIVEDNGRFADAELAEKINASLASVNVQKEATGLQNVHRRLQIQFGSRAGLEVKVRQGGGLGIEIKLVCNKAI